MAKFFIHRPVFAMVISLVILIAGGLSLTGLPIAQYPQITPPTVSVSINYPGANAETVEQSIATPVEQAVNGAENMIYFTSKSSNDGQYSLTCTFKVGTNLDIANVDINNRVNKASSSLPPDAVSSGISVNKQSPDMLMVISILSPDNTYDDLFLSNYASINIVDAVARTPGVGSTQIIGQRDYSMRLWVRPDKLTKLGLTGSDLVNVIREQNVLAPAGSIGQPPAKAGTEFQYTVNVQGRLTTAEEFSNMVVRTLPDGSVLRIKDLARTEMAAKTYTSYGRLNGVPATLIIVYQLPGANAIDTANSLTKLMSQLSSNFPPGLKYEISFDTTKFVRAAIEEVIHALWDAIILVLIVVFIFLGNFRATIIPMLAVPVSLVGTFAAFVPLGFSINTLTLFGIVLAVGIVVDDAIVVVEAVEHHIEHGLTPLAATEKAMEEVSGPVIAVALVLCAVFVPVAFMGGITGQLYRQFALTLSISVILSALVALTLTPALCQMLLRPRKQMRGPVGAFLRGFNHLFDKTTNGYGRMVRGCLRHMLFPLVVLLCFWAATGGFFKMLPTGFVPDEDQGYFFAAVALPDGASMERTDALTRKLEKYLQGVSGVKDVMTMGGLNILTGAYTSNNATMICLLKPWEERKTPATQLDAIVNQVRQELSTYPEALIFPFTPPPISGLGNAGGFQFELQDRGGRPAYQLAETADKFAAEASKRPELIGLYSQFRTNVPQIKLDLDRDKVKTLGVPVNSVFESLQIFLGGLQVNDFNRFGRTYKVMIQAEPEFRVSPDNIDQIYVRSSDATMVPLSTITKISSMTGPDVIQRYNMYRTSEISGAAAPGYSSGQALDAMEKLAKTNLPEGYSAEWTGTAFQERQAGGAQSLIFALGVVFVFLFLAAQYESWAIPLSVMFGIPLGVFGAFLSVWGRGLVNNVYVQIGLVMLIGLAAKNAILIVEFAKNQYEQGKPLKDAALEGARIRFRPILMTSFAFILGVIPLVTASGAGSASRQSLGTAVCGGMTAATVLGVFLIPVLYVVVQGLSAKVTGSPAAKVKPPLAEGEHR
ncbi:MAG: multidrug efflux RND transporter permease subunit [Deltaproteobacteria bacterium]|nr:multidrug efflux RND transporter permease subunit [Deltaproteobacteria bacterium]